MRLLFDELTGIWYYFDIQLRQIALYWALGILIGSAVSVFAKDRLHSLLTRLRDSEAGVLALIPAALIGIASPLCMYGTVPIAASFSKKGVPDEVLAAFMMSSVLLNPQLLIYSAALGATALTVRFVTCFLCGVGAGLLVRRFARDRSFFSFGSFGEPDSRDTDPNLLLRYAQNVLRNLRSTGLWFLAGVLLSALFQKYVPEEAFAGLFGAHRGFGLLMAATVGVPLYACGGGTVPLLQQWLASGMSLGSAAAFMITGPATKITNLGALKIVLGARSFGLYLAWVMAFALLSGLATDLVCLAAP
ncbi:MAG: permease [Abditibacteriota bacterium]|nr:permease [Abditibacteriota bacterium]